MWVSLPHSTCGEAGGNGTTQRYPLEYGKRYLPAHEGTSELIAPIWWVLVARPSIDSLLA